MKRVTGKSSVLFAVLMLLALGLTSARSTRAQQRTVEQKEAGPAKITVDTRHSTVAYVEGNHLVVRLQDGSLEAIRIPPEERFNIDGEQHALYELQPGMILTDEVYSTEQPMVVKTVEITEGRVSWASPGLLIIHTRDGKAAEYRIPEWATIKINGEERSLHELKRGTMITATITTEEGMTVVNRDQRSHGHHPAELVPTASEDPLLTIPDVPRARAAELQPVAETPEELPETASLMPLLGLLGLISIASAISLRAFRKTTNR